MYVVLVLDGDIISTVDRNRINHRLRVINQKMQNPLEKIIHPRASQEFRNLRALEITGTGESPQTIRPAVHAAGR